MSGAVQALVWAGSIAGAITAIAVAWQKTKPVRGRLVRVVERFNRALDVVLGTPEIPDPDRPGEVLRHAIPDLGVRMTRAEELLSESVLGTVEQARQSAQAAAESARAAAESAAAAERIAETVKDLPRKVQELQQTVQTWQERDRTKAEVATSVLAEIGHTTGEALRPEGDG